jgi:hypothetical protein
MEKVHLNATYTLSAEQAIAVVVRRAPVVVEEAALQRVSVRVES